METLIEEVQTSKDIKYNVLVWFMDMAMETTFLVRQNTSSFRLVLNF